MQKYLRKQVGRPWDKVYSELSQTLDRRSLSGRHIWTHVRQEVTIDCHLEGKIVYPNVENRYITTGQPVKGLYVHPITGLLCYKARNFQRTSIRSAVFLGVHLERKFNLKISKLVPDDWLIVDDLTVLERRKGIWYVRLFVALDPNQIVGRVSVDGKESLVYLYQMTKFFKTQVKFQQLGRKHPLWKMIKK